jgi:hypothetical protein
MDLVSHNTDSHLAIRKAVHVMIDVNVHSRDDNVADKPQGYYFVWCCLCFRFSGNEPQQQKGLQKQQATEL